jgi:hypothetical protein
MATAAHPEQTRAAWDISEVVRTASGKAMLQDHLAQITEGPAFKGSQRSAQFLEYIVHQSALGNIDGLKERVIGMELFGRLPSYDTGEDAIVRVTATDVRKRLLQHYRRSGNKSEFQISLPTGKYVAELIRNPVPGADVFAPPSFSEAAQPKSVNPPPIPIDPPPTPQSMERRHWLLPVIGLVTMLVGLVLAIQNWPRHVASTQKLIGAGVQAPWAALFDGSRPVLLVASDPNIEEIQRIAHRSVTLSDYANRDYVPHGIAHLSPFQIELMKDILRGNKMADFDGGIIAGMQSLLPSGAPRLVVKGARAIRIQDLDTDDNLVLLGSPRSNPWTSMYDPLLDFRFTFDDQTQREFIRDLRPVKGEKNEYVPTAGGYDTGQSFATVSVFKNPEHAGHVLIIAGTNGEGTQAAGDIVTNPVRWEEVLRPCHLSGTGSRQALEILLQLGTMAGSANDVKVVACHLLTPD